MSVAQWAVCLVVLGAAVPASQAAALAPAADGTIADGGSFGAFDGIGDSADWTFNESGYEGAITLARSTVPALEYRVVFKYDLASVSALTTVTATLAFKLRGTTRFPADATPVEVVAFSSDLAEKTSDFAAGPVALVATRKIEPMQPATAYTINVSVPVQAAVRNGSRAIAFRFQVAGYSTADSDQAFIDAIDSDPSTKPTLTVVGRLPGDLDGDADVDLADYGRMDECLLGPSVIPGWNCVLADVDSDSDVDLRDFGVFARLVGVLTGP